MSTSKTTSSPTSLNKTKHKTFHSNGRFCFVEYREDLYKWMKFEACEENILSAMVNRANDILLKHNEEVRHLDESV